MIRSYGSSVRGGQCVVGLDLTEFDTPVAAQTASSGVSSGTLCMVEGLAR